MMSVVGERVGDTLMDDLPNLKIEIENDLDQKMDTDDEASSGEKAGNISSETEEGEVSDDDDEEVNNLLTGKSNQAAILGAQTVPTGRSILKYGTEEFAELQPHNAVKNPNGAFVTGVNVFSPEEQAKLDKRALRFGIEAVEGKVLTEKLLKKLYKSMGVKPTDKHIRIEALHMRGTKGMKTQDVFSYFKDYGPASLEWITENSCNVVWLDEVSAARALLGLSVHIAGQTDSTRPPERRASADTDSDVDMDQPSVPAAPTTDTPAEEADDLSEESDAVTTEELGVDLPPGRWRRGAPHPFSPCILLRFATTSDKPVPKQHLPSHQFGAGYVGLISESRKRRMQQALPNPILFDDVGDEIIPKPSADDTDNVNPWGALAKTWGRFDKVRKPRPPSPVIERLLPMPTRMTPPPSPPVFSSQRAKLVPRTRLRREREAAHRQEAGRESVEEVSSDTEEWSKRSKMPRMRMHADDEEKRIEKRLKRRHHDRSRSSSPPRVKDLRHKLRPSAEEAPAKVKVEAVTSSSSSSESEDSSEEESGEGEEEVPDLRVAVPTETEAEKETKPIIRQSLFTTGNIKSVLRGARGYSENDEDDEDEESEHSDKGRSSRRHRSRSKERRKHHRKHKNHHHKSRRKAEDSDSDEETGKMKSTIRRRSPERNRRSPESRDRRRRRDEDHRRSETSRRSDKRREDKSSRDLRSKISQRSRGYDLDNEFRSKSPLQIELDNDYYKGSESE